MNIGKNSIFTAIGAIAVLAATAGGIQFLFSEQQEQLAAQAKPSNNLMHASINNSEPADNNRKLLTVSTAQVKQCNGDMALDGKALLALPQQRFTTKHTWAEQAEEFSGPLLKDVLSLACPNIKVSRLMLKAINDYSVEMDFSKLQAYKPIIALSVNGQRLSIRNKGPLWVMLPVDEFAELPPRSLDDMMIWQLSDINILSTD